MAAPSTKIEKARNYVREQISQRLTTVYSKLGYVHRNDLADGIRQITVKNRAESRKVIDVLVERGVLKERFREVLKDDVRRIEPFMLRKTVEREQAAEIFRGSGAVLEKIAGGLDACWDTVTMRFDSDQVHLPGFQTAMLLGASAAFGIGATLAGLPAVTGFGACAATGLVASALRNVVSNPNSTVGRICEFGEKLMIPSFGLMVAAVAVDSFHKGLGIFDNTIKGYISRDGIFYGAAASIALTYYMAKRATKKAISTHFAALKPNSDRYIGRMMKLSGFKILFGANYLLYRLATTMVLNISLLSKQIILAPNPMVLAAGMVVGLAARFTTRLGDKTFRERLTEPFADYIESRINKFDSKEVDFRDGKKVKISGMRDADGEVAIELKLIETGAGNAEDVVKLVEGFRAANKEEMTKLVSNYMKQNPEFSAQYIKPVEETLQAVYNRTRWVQWSAIDKIVAEYIPDMLLKYGPFLAFSLTFAHSATSMLADLATLYFSGWTLFADWHSEHASVMNAVNIRRSIFNTEDPYISDAQKADFQDFCVRLVAYIAEKDRNFSKLANTLLAANPYVEVEYMGETNPNRGLDDVRGLRVARKEVFPKMAEWQQEIYGKVQKIYAKFPENATPARTKRAAVELAKVLRELADMYYPDPAKPANADSFIARIQKLIEEDKKRPGPDKWFNLGGEEEYVRTTYSAIRERGYRFLEQARKLEEKVRYGLITPEELQAEFMELLGSHSVRYNHVVRKEDWNDDHDPTKSKNLGFTETHLGDSLYKVWRLVRGTDRTHCIKEFIPSTYIRINNPKYDHRAGRKQQNYKYVWLRREDLLKVIGLSQSASNDVKLVDNAPANVASLEKEFGEFSIPSADHELKKVHGFYSNEELLEPRKIIYQDGRIEAIDGSTWVSGEKGKTPAQISSLRESFKQWAREQYREKVTVSYVTVDEEAVKIDFPAGKGLHLRGVRDNRWTDIAYALVKTDAQGHEYLEAFKKGDDKKGDISLGVIDHAEWGIKIHDAALIKTFKVKENGKEVSYPRIEFKVETYDKWVESLKDKDAIWFTDAPEALFLAPTKNFNISDEGFIVIDSEQRLGLELNDTARKDKLLRVVQYEESQASFPNPDIKRQIEHLRSYTMEDADVAISYTTREGKTEIPYAVDRTMFARAIKADDWKRIGYGLIGKDRSGIEYIDVYSKDNQLIGRVATTWPAHMHPSSQITSVDRATGRKRLEFDVFSKRTGKSTWLRADYGDNYGREMYQRYRWTRLDPDREAKQETWPNFVTEISEKDGRIFVKSVHPKCVTVPFDKKFAGIRWAKEAEVMEVDSSGRIFMDPEGHTWSPVADGLHTIEVKKDKKQENVGILLLRDGDKEQVIELTDLPPQLSTPKNARRVVKVERVKGEEGEDKLVFIKLRMDSSIEDDPHFIYSLPEELYGPNKRVAQKKYKILEHLLDRHDITVRITPKKTGRGYDVKLIDENGKPVDLDIDLGDLRDKDGERFLGQPGFGMGKLEDFYQAANGNYEGTEEFRPRLAKFDGKIKLILTRVEKVEVQRNLLTNNQVFELIGERSNLQMFFAMPTSAARVKVNGKEKWVPLSLTVPAFNAVQAPNVGTVGVKVQGRSGKPETIYLHNVAVSKDLPEGTVMIKSLGKKFYAYGVTTKNNRNRDVILVPQRLGEVSPEVAQSIRESLAKNGIKRYMSVTIEVSHTSGPEVIDGEFQTVVHAQRQQGAMYKHGAFLGADMAQMRDELFYSVVREMFGEAFPANKEFRCYGIQRGRGFDRDRNDMYTGKPIENGTPFVMRHKHLFELAASILGLPKGSILAMAPMLDRAGGYEKVSKSPFYAKLIPYCREKGWLNGVSEDEQSALALALALGYTLKYYVRITAFESQPNTAGQVDRQDNDRYNTAMALARDVMIPYAWQEVKNWFDGQSTVETYKRIAEHISFCTWYLWPWGKMIREASPSIFFVTKSAVKPMVVDGFFLGSWGADTAIDIAMNKEIRKDLGRTKEESGRSPIDWTLRRSPAMNQAFLFSSLQATMELFRKGKQYGAFPVTALGKTRNVPADYKKFISYILTTQAITGVYGAWTSVIPLICGVKDMEFAYGVNLVWLAYSMFINREAQKVIHEFEVGNPENEAMIREVQAKLQQKVKQFQYYLNKGRMAEAEKIKDEMEAEANKCAEAIAFTSNREKVQRQLDDDSMKSWNAFRVALNLVEKGKINEARQLLRRLIADNSTDRNVLLMAENQLKGLGR